MSLINRMLSDLEERRGGNLRNVDHAIDGLRATPAPTTRRKKRIPPATLAAGLLIAGLTALCAYLLVSRAPASPVAQVPAAAAVPAAEQVGADRPGNARGHRHSAGRGDHGRRDACRPARCGNRAARSAAAVSGSAGRPHASARKGGIARTRTRTRGGPATAKVTPAHAEQGQH
jgi:hypothetical protein